MSVCFWAVPWAQRSRLSGHRTEPAYRSISTAALAEGANVPILICLKLSVSKQRQADAVLNDVLGNPWEPPWPPKALYWAAERKWLEKLRPQDPPHTRATCRFQNESARVAVHLGMYEKLGVQAVAKPVSEVLPPSIPDGG